mgnify:CR=1 FL=1
MKRGIVMKTFAGKLFVPGILILLSLFSSSSCDRAYFSDEETGALSVSVSMADARMTVPDINENDFSFTITGSGPDGSTFDTDTEEGVSDVTIGSLVFGTWEITVEAIYHGTSEEVSFGDGMSYVDVHAGDTSSCSVSITPFEGQGTLDLSVTWDSSAVASPVLECTLTRVGYDDVSADLTPGDGSASASLALESGIYSLSIVLKDGETYEYGGVVDSVRIINSLTTTAAYEIVGETMPDTEAPSVPANLAATDVQSYRVSLSWDASSDNVGVAGYRVYRDGSALGTSGSTSFADTTVAAEEEYSYTVSAYDAAGNESGQSDALPVSTPASSGGGMSDLTDVDVSNPSSPVRLCFIHHSCGYYWLQTGNGNLGTNLNDASYYVTECYYNWSAESGDYLGNSTDTDDWPSWFNDTKMPYVYDNSSHYAYTNSISDPGDENTIIMFKSCYPCSEVGSSIEDEKEIYNGLLDYFEVHPEKLFILVIPPPEIVISSASLTRELANWLADYQNGWLASYPGRNVFAFDFYNVLTDPNNHHRVEGAEIVHTVSTSPVDGDNPDELYYYSGSDSHPTAFGNQKATEEFIPLLNAVYNYWNE